MSHCSYVARVLNISSVDENFNIPVAIFPTIPLVGQSSAVRNYSSSYERRMIDLYIYVS